MIDNNHVIILVISYQLTYYGIFESYSRHSVFDLPEENFFPSTIHSKNILPTTMLAFLVTSIRSVTTVYNEVIVDISCHLLSTSQGLISTTQTRKY